MSDTQNPAAPGVTNAPPPPPKADAKPSSDKSNAPQQPAMIATPAPTDGTASPPFKIGVEGVHDHPYVPNGKSQSPGLRPVPGSFAPADARGNKVQHVYGPGQAAVDPIAAGLDTENIPTTRAENRAVTQTGELGAGPPPATYSQHGDAAPAQRGSSDGATVAANPDKASEATPGPSSAGEGSEAAAKDAAPEREPTAGGPGVPPPAPATPAATPEAAQPDTAARATSAPASATPALTPSAAAPAKPAEQPKPAPAPTPVAAQPAPAPTPAATTAAAPAKPAGS